MIESVYKNEPVEIAVTADYKEALDIIAEEKIKVVLSDQIMPEISGVDFLIMIKEKFPDILRILITANEDHKVTQRAINEAEVFRFLGKPLDTKQFMQVIRKAVDQYDLSRNSQLYEWTREKNIQLRDLNKTLFLKIKCLFSFLHFCQIQNIINQPAQPVDILDRHPQKLPLLLTDFTDGPAQNNIDRGLNLHQRRP